LEVENLDEAAGVAVPSSIRGDGSRSRSWQHAAAHRHLQTTDSDSVSITEPVKVLVPVIAGVVPVLQYYRSTTGYYWLVAQH
jgi:hypothetical protein